MYFSVFFFSLFHDHKVEILKKGDVYVLNGGKEIENNTGFWCE